MAIYTVSLNFLENLEISEMSYIGCVLFCFSNNQHPDKLAVDKNKIILNKYIDVVDSRFADIIRSWVDMLSYIPSSIEKIDVDLTEITDTEEMCLALCSSTKGSKQLIVHSIGLLESSVDASNCISYKGCTIKVLDKDEAKQLLNVNSVLNINRSVVAGGNICDTTNTQGYGE